MGTPEQDDHRVAILVEANERHRSRSRAVATLIAAAAAGLAAALILSPSTVQPHFAQIIGAIAVGLLLIATTAFISASLVYAGQHYIQQGSVRGLVSCLIFWRLQPSSEEENPSSAHLEKVAKEVQGRISHINNAGAILAGLGVLGLMGCFGILVFDQDVTAQMTVTEPENILAVCPKYAPSFPVTVASSALRGNSDSIPVVLRARACGVSADVLAFVPRTSVAFKGVSQP
jgi:hypothetical protein